MFFIFSFLKFILHYCLLLLFIKFLYYSLLQFEFILLFYTLHLIMYLFYSFYLYFFFLLHIISDATFTMNLVKKIVCPIFLFFFLFLSLFLLYYIQFFFYPSFNINLTFYYFNYFILTDTSTYILICLHLYILSIYP